MTPCAERAIELVRQQPADAQRRTTEVLQTHSDEREWHVMVVSPQGQATRARLAAEAREDIARGEIEMGGWE